MRYKLLVVIFLLSLVVKAGSLPSLAIEMVDGAEDIFILEDMPVITLSDTELKVKTEHLSVIYEIDNVRNYHFKDADQGICDGSINNNLYFINAEEIEVNGPDIKKVTLCDLNGVTLLNVPNGGGKINLSYYPPGVYIILYTRVISTNL